MTAEQPSSGDGAGELVPRPALRASHAERDQVVEVLREAAGDGRLTDEELEQRVEASLSPRTGSDLPLLTADLPARAGARPQDGGRIDQRFGTVTREGRWVVPQRMEIKAKAGNVKLDFTEAVLTFDTLHIALELGLGADLLLVTKPGIMVLTDDLTVRVGDVKVRQPPAGRSAPVILRIELSGKVSGG